MLTIKRIKEFETLYAGHMDIIRDWDQQMTKQNHHDAWMQVMQDRSQAMRRIYLENQSQIRQFLKELKEPMDQDTREHLYETLIRLFYGGNYDDYQLMMEITNHLLPYYKEESDHVHRIHLLNVKAYLSAEYIYRQSCHPEKYFYATIHTKLYKYHTIYDKLKKPERVVILSNMFNMICGLPMVLPHELNTALDIYDEFLQMEQNEIILAQDAGDAALDNKKASIHEGVWNIAEIIEHFDEIHLFHFYDLLKEEYDQKKLRDDIPRNLVSAYYYVSAYLKEIKGIDTGISWYSAYTYLLHEASRLLTELESMVITTVDESFLFQHFYPYQECANYVFKIVPYVIHDIDSFSLKDFVHRGTRLLYSLPKSDHIWLLYAMNTEWCQNALGVLTDPYEQKELISRIIVKGQPQTYIHSQMVAQLAVIILHHMIEYVPELLLTLPNVTDVAQIRSHKSDFVEFVNCAALYHDVGKSKISTVINLQTRALVKEEFDLIKEHPEHPELGVLINCTEFEKYYDIIQGHHKSYDGKTGYPEYFDNVHSPCRILIDLISLCDCLDAATDRLGRNYAGGKDLNNVLREIEKGSGTRYNPDIVALIIRDKGLREELETIVTSGRKEIYYKTYKEYFC